jgi:Tfp pilus assembly pilus retraction ATPase PilT
VIPVGPILVLLARLAPRNRARVAESLLSDIQVTYSARLLTSDDDATRARLGEILTAIQTVRDVLRRERGGRRAKH